MVFSRPEPALVNGASHTREPSPPQEPAPGHPASTAQPQSPPRQQPRSAAQQPAPSPPQHPAQQQSPIVQVPEQSWPPIQRLGDVLRGGGPPWWFMGCHGGAGVTTLTAAISGGIDAGRYWPVPDPPAATNVILVARSHAGGLRAAQAAAWQWASGALPTVRLLGLAVIADAPGRRPKPLKDLLNLISGGVPCLWELPWVEDLRLGAPPGEAALPPAFAAMAADLQKIVTGGTHA